MSTFKKESGAQGRKRRVAEAAQSQKDSSHFRSFFNVVPSKKVAKMMKAMNLKMKPWLINKKRQLRLAKLALMMTTGVIHMN